MEKVKAFIITSSGAWYTVLIVSAVIMTAAFSPFLFFGAVIEGDSTLYQIPHLAFYKDAILTEDSYLWNPYNVGGFPVFASLNGFFFPLHFVLLLFVSPAFATHFLLFLSATLALFCMVQFLRELGIGFAPAFLGGVSFVTSEMFFLTHTTTLAFALAFLPLVFYLVMKIEKNERIALHSIILVSVIALGWLVIFPQFIIMSLCAALGLVLFRVANTRCKKVLALFIVCNVIGFAIGLAQLLPTYFLAQTSVRANSVVPYKELSDRAIRERDITRFYFPEVYTDIPLYVSDGKNKPAQTFLYMGIISFCFFIFSLFLKGSFITFFRWLFFIILLISIKFSPLFYVLTKLPVIGDFRVPSRYMLVGSFAAAVLVAFGADSFFSKQIPNVSRRRFALITTCAVIGSIVGMLVLFPVSLYVLEKLYPHPYLSTPGIQAIINLVHTIPELFRQAFGKAIIPIAILLSALGVILFWDAKKISHQRAFACLLLLATLDFFAVFFLYTPTRASLYPKPTPPLVQFLQERKHDRVLTFNISPDEGDRIPQGEFTPEQRLYLNHAELRDHNVNLLYGFSSVDYYEKLVPANVARLLYLVGAGAGNENYGFENGLNNITDADEKIEMFKERRGLVNFLGIRYIVSSSDLQPIGFKKVFTPLDQGTPSIQTSVALYENEKAQPLAYLIKRVEGRTEREEVFRAFLESKFKEFFIVCSCPSYQFSGNGDIAMLVQKNNTISLTTSSPERQFMVLSQNDYPGWQAFIDDKEVPIYEVNSAHMGIFLPAGDHHVAFRYTYRAFMKDNLSSLYE